jgi:hypothetical protein
MVFASRSSLQDVENSFVSRSFDVVEYRQARRHHMSRGKWRSLWGRMMQPRAARRKPLLCAARMGSQMMGAHLSR